MAWARMLGCSLLLSLAAGLVGALHAPREAVRAPAPVKARTVYLAGGLSPEQLVQCGSAVRAADPEALFLIDDPACRTATRGLFDGLGCVDIVPIGSFNDTQKAAQTLHGFRDDAIVRWESGHPERLWQRLFPRAERVVVCPAQPRRLLLQAACLAGALRAPLYLLHGEAGEGKRLVKRLADWQTTEVFLAGDVKLDRALPKGTKLTTLRSEASVAIAHRRLLRQHGPIRSAVVANPVDFDERTGWHSALAPWLALSREAALLLTEPDGYDAADLVRRAPLKDVDNVLILGTLERIPVECRANPIPEDKDAHIEMEPLTPEKTEPFSYCVGRLFHEAPAVVPMMLARGELLSRKKDGLRALVVSNPGESLPLLETFSRQTVRELRNGGVQAKAVYGKEVTKELLKKELPGHDVFLWEGHHNTLIRDWEFADWQEPLPPSLVFLQSCLMLREWKVHPLQARGAVAVLGSSCRTYSASGGATSLAFFNAMLYDGQTVGGGLRQAKNFLLAYAQLKEKRLGKEATRTGANLRAAWSFSLWGDPTLQMPAPPKPEGALAPVRHKVKGSTITVALPEEKHDKVISTRYLAELPPNGRMAGLLRKEKTEDGQPLVPFVFAEVALPKAPEGMKPVLHSRLPGRYWVFNWDARRRCGYLLLTPRPQDQGELRFRVEWVDGGRETASQWAKGAE